MSNRPLLSICIPTYNRGYILREVLEKYVNDSEFDDDVEIVISDNCSTDNTESVCKEYASKYSNIRYFRNLKNIRDANFYTVLDYGEGEYLKLLNDWTYCVGDSLVFLKNKIHYHIKNKKPCFFSNGLLFTSQKNKQIVECNSLDEYVQAVSTYVTSNNLFGAWRDQWHLVKDKSRYTDLKLQQEDWTYQIVKNGNGCVIYNEKIFNNSMIKRRILSGYNWFEVHLDNYYKIMMPYVNNGDIHKRTIERDKHYLLEHFREEMCYIYFYNFNTRWQYGTEGTSVLLRKYYADDSYLVYYFFKLPFYYPYYFLKYVIKKLLKIGS